MDDIGNKDVSSLKNLSDIQKTTAQVVKGKPTDHDINSASKLPEELISLEKNKTVPLKIKLMEGLIECENLQRYLRARTNEDLKRLELEQSLKTSRKLN